ncbi:MAG: rod shape-determining protein MreD [Candidatus Omnitrophota bacterium]
MRAIVLFFICLITAFIQLNWNYYFNTNITPQFLFILCVFFSLLLKDPLSFMLSAFNGLLLDIFSSGLFGLNIITYTLWNIFLKRIKFKVYREQIFTQGLIIFIGVIINFLILAVFSHNFSIRLIIIAAFYTFLLSLAIIYLLKKLFNYFKIKISYR